MTNIEELLARLLGMTDAIWLPLRDFDRKSAPNYYFARRDYTTIGVDWRSGAASEAGRKAAQRDLEAAADSGLVQAFRPKRGKVLGVKLTDEGEEKARVLCGLPSLYAGLVLVKEVARREQGKGTVHETALAGVEYGAPDNKKALMLVEDMALPALVRGWLDAGASIHRDVRYSTTEAGRKALEGDWPKDHDGDDYDHQARECYFEALREMQSRLADSEPQDRREIGIIPLPCSY